jgi:hypothetical protein
LPTGKHTGRKRQFCDDTCKDNYRRQLNFEFYGKPRKPVIGNLKTVLAIGKPVEMVA